LIDPFSDSSEFCVVVVVVVVCGVVEIVEFGFSGIPNNFFNNDSSFLRIGNASKTSSCELFVFVFVCKNKIIK